MRIHKNFDIAVASSYDPKASCEPPLKPYQPIHKIKVPSVTSGIEDGANGVIFVGSPVSVKRPNLGPNKITPAKAADPPQA